MRKITALALVAAGATATAVGISSPALAATWTVANSTGSFSGTTGTTGTTVLRSSSSVAITCSPSGTTPAATASGTTLANGNYPNGNGIASINNAAFNNCKGPLNLTFAVTTTTPWSLNAVGTDAAHPGWTVGTITNVAAKVTATGCSADVAGGVQGWYDNAGHLIVDPTAPNPNGVQLTISNVSGCFGLITNGQHPTFTGTYNVTPSTLTVTTP